MSPDGLYVLGGANGCPQAVGPLFARPAARRAGGTVRGVGGDGQEGVGEHREGDMAVPGAVAADLIMVQAGLVLGLGEAVFHRYVGS